MVAEHDPACIGRLIAAFRTRLRQAQDGKLAYATGITGSGGIDKVEKGFKAVGVGHMGSVSQFVGSANGEAPNRLPTHWAAWFGYGARTGI